MLAQRATIQKVATATSCSARPLLRPVALPPRHICSVAEKDATTTKGRDATADVQAALASLAGTAGDAAGGADSGIANLTKDLIMADPEMAEQLKRYEAALARVEAAKAAAAELEDIFEQGRRELALQAGADVAARSKAEEIMADAEVAAAEKLLLAAQLEAAEASQRADQLKSQVTSDAERIESAKAGAVAILGGLAVQVPLLLAGQAEATAIAEPLTQGLTFSATLTACFLFGATYRYVMRHDVHNSHLRSGAVGAFGLVRAGANAETLATTSQSGPLDLNYVVGPALLYCGESMLMFAFCALALEAAFNAGFVKRFGAASEWRASMDEGNQQ